MRNTARFLEIKPKIKVNPTLCFLKKHSDTYFRTL